MDNDPVASVPGSQVYGFPPVYYPGGAEPSAAAAIELDAGQTVQADIEIQGKPYHQVRIPVANADINNGFSVTVEGQQGSRFELGFNSNEQRIEGMLPAGELYGAGHYLRAKLGEWEREYPSGRCARARADACPGAQYQYPSPSERRIRRLVVEQFRQYGRMESIHLRCGGRDCTCRPGSRAWTRWSRAVPRFGRPLRRMTSRWRWREFLRDVIGCESRHPGVTSHRRRWVRSTCFTSHSRSVLDRARR